ncbi:obscurin-like [Hydractinia symbiolongicarpus]|uniref:obscurin-like n=1 Tax=Hydractinia symbiolongicarpus TaxID=13093 RepID=UPI00254BEF6F|nr:obscurin-like [Hydractinia symbiolongicarpus]
MKLATYLLLCSVVTFLKSGYTYDEKIIKGDEKTFTKGETTIQKKSVTGCLGAPITLDPMDWMNPAYYVRWTQNDVDLSSFKYNMYYGKLIFFRLAATDRGVYVAYQRETAKELEFTLKIPDNTLTVEGLQEITTNAFETVILKVHMASGGYGQWKMNGIYLKTGEHHHLSFTSDSRALLEIDNIQTRHAGTYHFFYAVEGCESSKQWVVNVLQTDTKENLKVCPGDTAILKSTSLDGLLTWKRENNIEIFSNSKYELTDDTHVLKIHNVSQRDAGVYIALAVDGSKVTYTLTVPDTTLLSLDKPTKVNVNDRVVLRAYAKHNGTFTWMHGKTVLTKTSKSSHFIFPDLKSYNIVNGSVLGIRDIKEEHAGVYKLYYQVGGCKATLSWFIEVQKNKETVCPGDTAILRSTSLDGLLTWKRENNIELFGNSKYELIDDTHVLKIHNLSPKDAGVYTAIASDGNKVSFTLTVPDTTLLSMDKSLKVKVNGRAVLRAYAKHHGVFTWMHGNTVLTETSEASHFIFPDPKFYDMANGSVLEIRNIQKEHAGVYNLNYQINGCKSSLSWSIEVQKIEAKSMKVCPGSIAVMNPVSMQENGLLLWQRDSVDIQETARYDFSAYNHVLKIYDVKPNDAGVYTALANDGDKTLFTLHVPDTTLQLLDSGYNVFARKHDRVILRIQTTHRGESTWKFENKLLISSPSSEHFVFPDSKVYGIANGSVLEIHNIHEQHAGTYTFDHLVDSCRNEVKIFVHVMKKKFVPERFSDPIASYKVVAPPGEHPTITLRINLAVILVIVFAVIVGIIYVCFILCKDLTQTFERLHYSRYLPPLSSFDKEKYIKQIKKVWGRSVKMMKKYNPFNKATIKENHTYEELPSQDYDSLSDHDEFDQDIEAYDTANSDVESEKDDKNEITHVNGCYGSFESNDETREKNIGRTSQQDIEPIYDSPTEEHIYSDISNDEENIQ